MNAKTALATAIFFGVGLAGCAADMKIVPAGPVPEARIAKSAPAAAPAAPAAIADATIIDNVKATLSSPALNAGHLKVTAKSGEVTLSGDVEDGQQLARIAMAVQKVPGVKAVIPDIMPKR
jgi:BON domain